MLKTKIRVFHLIGINLFAAMGLTGKPPTQMARSVAPFILILLVCIFLVTFMPDIALFLLRMLFNDRRSRFGAAPSVVSQKFVPQIMGFVIQGFPVRVKSDYAAESGQ